ncbi:MAG: hypothetical protein ABMA25_00320 [Ilumatobacteraceae bacterium]
MPFTSRQFGSAWMGDGHQLPALNVSLPSARVKPLQMPMAASVEVSATPSARSGGLASWTAISASLVALPKLPSTVPLNRPSDFSTCCTHSVDGPRSPGLTGASATQAGGGATSTPE